MNKYDMFIRSCRRRLFYLESMFKKEPNDIQPYVYMRIFSESETLCVTLKTLLRGGVKRGIIGYNLDDNGKDDGTKEIILNFCKQNPSFVPVEYPYNVVPIKPGSDVSLVNIQNRFDTYCNYIMDKIPNNEWFIKCDGDHLYNPEALKILLNQPLKYTNTIYLPLVNMHYDNGELYIYKHQPYWNGADNWLIYKHKATRWYMEDSGHEQIYSLSKHKKFDHIASLHFPFMKKRRKHLATKENLIPYDDFDFSQIPMSDIDKEFILNKNKILSYFVD